MLGRMDVSPFNTTPLQVGETIKNYHPKDIYSQLSKRDIGIEKDNKRLQLQGRVFKENIRKPAACILRTHIPGHIPIYHPGSKHLFKRTEPGYQRECQ